MLVSASTVRYSRGTGTVTLGNGVEGPARAEREERRTTMAGRTRVLWPGAFPRVAGPRTGASPTERGALRPLASSPPTPRPPGER